MWDRYLTDGLRLSAALAEDVLAHARSGLPNEACGILSGPRPGVASAFHPARNAAASPLRYELDPNELVRILYALEREGQQLVAIFHSHVRSAAVPSATDRREAHYPGALHLLASMTDAWAAPRSALRAWRIQEGLAHEVALTIVSGNLAP